MPVPASASSMFGASFWRRGAKTDVASSAIAVCPSRGSDRARSARQARSRAAAGSTRHGPRRRPVGRFLPLLEAREEHALAALGPFEPRGDQRRPAPAQPCQRLARRPRAFALLPVRAFEHVAAAPRRSRGSDAAASASLVRRLEPDRAAHARHRRHREPRRMDEGEQLQQVEARQIRIAEPLPDQRRVEDDVRSLGRPGDRLAPARLARFASPRRRARFRRGLRAAREGAEKALQALYDARTKVEQPHQRERACRSNALTRATSSGVRRPRIPRACSGRCAAGIAVVAEHIMIEETAPRGRARPAANPSP